MVKPFLFLSALLFIACSNSAVKTPDRGKIKQMDWLIGSWENLSAEGDMFENWHKVNDSTYTGESFVIVKGDTVFSENMTLELRTGDLLFVAITSGQHADQGVSFKFTSLSNGETTFENKEHDFPQRVIYKNPKPDSLYARIEGTENGKSRKEEFFMVRKR